jgi:hypothetical protein
MSQLGAKQLACRQKKAFPRQADRAIVRTASCRRQGGAGTLLAEHGRSGQGQRRHSAERTR